jgi:hypothetical protein
MGAKPKNKCSLVVINNETGNVLRGTAAILHATSRAGGFDQYMKKYGEKILQGAFDAQMKEERAPRLRRIG